MSTSQFLSEPLTSVCPQLLESTLHSVTVTVSAVVPQSSTCSPPAHHHTPAREKLLNTNLSTLIPAQADLGLPVALG